MSERRPRCITCGALAKRDGDRFVHDDPAVSLVVDHAARVWGDPARPGDPGCREASPDARGSDLPDFRTESDPECQPEAERGTEAHRAPEARA